MLSASVGVELSAITDEVLREKLLELLATDHDSPDFLRRYDEFHRLLDFAMATDGTISGE